MIDPKLVNNLDLFNEVLGEQEVYYSEKLNNKKTHRTSSISTFLKKIQQTMGTDISLHAAIDKHNTKLFYQSHLKNSPYQDLITYLYRPDMFIKNSKYTTGVLWISNKHTITPAHYDHGAATLNVPIIGEKIFHILSPTKSSYLDVCSGLVPTPTEDQRFVFTNKQISTAVSECDEKALCDLHENYTLVHLAAGNALYLPPFYFHEVISSSEINIGISWHFASENIASNALAERDDYLLTLFERICPDIFINDDKYRSFTSYAYKGHYNTFCERIMNNKHYQKYIEKERRFLD